jgi:hypothetical protein
MDSVLTLVVLSRQSTGPCFMHEGCVLLNHISHFDNAQGLHAARMAALQQVATPAFIFVDDTDSFLGPVSVPKGLCLGDEWVDFIDAPPLLAPQKHYNTERHFTSPTFIHRAICNTQAAKQVAAHLPQGEYYTEWLLYYFIAAWRGVVHPPGALYQWRKESGGMHTQVHQAMMNTQLWLMQNHKRVLAALRQSNV